MSRRYPVCLLAITAAISLVGVGDAPAQVTPPSGLMLYTIGNPSGDETEILETINRSRANPAAEGQRLVDAINAAYPNGGSDIDLNQLLTAFQSYPFRPPLAFNADLNTAAAGHLSDMIVIGLDTHTGSDGSTFASRMMAAGYPTPNAENVNGYGSADSLTPWEIESAYEVDEGVPSLGHRLNIMEWDDLGQVEIGIANQAVGGWDCEDFGSDQTPPLLTGAVFTDNAKTGFYVSGEGVGGYTVTAPGFSSYYAVTVASGAYTLPLDLVPTFTGENPPSATPPTVAVNFTDPNGNVTTQNVTLTHTDGPGALVYEEKVPNNVVVRYDNAASDLVLSATGTFSLSPLYVQFFQGETNLGDGVRYLAFANGNYFGYYSVLPDQSYIYHFDLGYEYVIDANDDQGGVYLYDFKSNDYFFTTLPPSPQYPYDTLPFPYLYDFNLDSVVYYYPDPNNAGHYNTDGIRYFYVFSTGQIVTK